METNINIEDFTKCYICMGKIIDATMCPNCQKLSCQRCIQVNILFKKKWLMERKNQCPHCRMPLKLTQIINIRFINDLTNLLEAVHNNKKELCKEHNINLLYYCSNCNESLCSDCYMFGNKHKEHEICKLDNVYMTHIEKIKKESNEVQEKYNKLKKLLNILEDRISFIRSSKQERANELESLYENSRHELETLMRTKLLKLLNCKSTISDKIDYLESIKKDIEKQLSENPKTALIAKTEELVNTLKSLNVDTDFSRDIFNISLDYHSDLIPKYESSIFEIKEFKNVMNSTKDIIYSPELQTNNLMWRLKVYPGGNGAAKGDYISVFIELLEGLYEQSLYFYKIELVNFNEFGVNYSREFSSDFQNGECWGYNRFYKLENLEKEGFIDKNGSIHIKYYVRPQNYALLARDQRNYINLLEKKLKIYENIVKDENLRSSEEITMNNFNLINNLNNINTSGHQDKKDENIKQVEELKDIIEEIKDIEKFSNDIMIEEIKENIEEETIPAKNQDIDEDVLITEINFKEIKSNGNNFENLENKQINKINVENNIEQKDFKSMINNDIKQIMNTFNNDENMNEAFLGDLSFNRHSISKEIRDLPKTPDESSFCSLMEMIMLAEDGTFNSESKSYLNNLEKIKKMKEENNIIDKKEDKKNRFNEILANLYPEGSTKSNKFHKKYFAKKFSEPLISESHDHEKLKKLLMKNKKQSKDK